MKQSNHAVAGKDRRKLLKAAGLVAVGLAGPFKSLSVAAMTEKESKLDAFSRSIDGTVISQGSRDYEPWRLSMIWNDRKFERYPEMIVQAHNDDDVVATVNFARENNLKIKARTGGHSWSGCYMRDGGILLDLSHFQSVEVNKKKKTAVIGAGVIGRSLNSYLGEHDLVFPTAHCGMVPLSGFLMGGGLGVNFSAWGGMSCFNILEMDVVTADGIKRRVSETENPELFWAARGGGPGLFFTVLRFKLQCYDLPHFIRTDTYLLPYEELIPTVEMSNEVGDIIGKGIEMLTIVVPSPAKGDVTLERKKGEFEQMTVLSATAFGYTQEEADRILAPIRNHPHIKKAVFTEQNRHSTLEHLYQDNEVPFPQRRARADNIYTNDVVEATRVLSKHMPESPAAGNTPVVLYMGDVKMHPETACYSAKGKFYLAGYAQWDRSEQDNDNQQWLKNMYDEMGEFASGYYINEYDRETRGDETWRCFGKENWEKLQTLRKKHDPSSVYHHFLEA